VAEAATVTIPAGHQLGDVILIFAFRDGSATNPTIPTGWTNITNTTDGGTLSSVSVGWKLAASSSETSGTWTNATGLVCHVYRGLDPIKPFGTFVGTQNTVANVQYSGVTITANQWIVAFVGHVSIDVSISSAPSGFTNITSLNGATASYGSFDTNGPLTVSYTAQNVAVGGTAGQWQTIMIPMYQTMARLNNYQSARSI